MILKKEYDEAPNTEGSSPLDGDRENELTRLERMWTDADMQTALNRHEHEPHGPDVDAVKSKSGVLDSGGYATWKKSQPVKKPTEEAKINPQSIPSGPRMK